MDRQRFDNRLPLRLEEHAASIQAISVVLCVVAAGLLAVIAEHGTTGDRIVTFATVLAAGLIVIRLTGGQFNASMELALATERHARKGSPATHHLVVVLTLKRGPVGRVRLEEVFFELSRLGSDDPKPSVHRSPLDAHGERIILESLKDDPIAESSSSRLLGMRRAATPEVRLQPSPLGTALPPGDATQLTYVFEVDAEDAFHVDVTIVGKRTAAWLGYPQWRASGTSFPSR